MDFDIDRRKLLKATGAGLATATIVSGKAGAVTDLNDLPGDGDEENPYEIGSFDDLLAIDQDLTANYVLTDHIEFPEEEPPIAPLGFEEEEYEGDNFAFTGTLDGQGFEIRNFEIEGFSSYTNSGAGLFGNIGEGGTVRNLNIVNIEVSGNDDVGALVGRFDGGEEGAIENVSVSGEADGSNPVGGIIGRMVSGIVVDSDADVRVEGFENLGGAVGLTQGGTVERSSAEGNVFGGDTNEGGFVGRMDDGSINQCYATGDVEGIDNVGGFAGSIDAGTVTQAYAWGDASGFTIAVGGFVGYFGAGSIVEVYAVGGVVGGEGAGGGLVGEAPEEEEEEETEVGSVTPLQLSMDVAYWDILATGQQDPIQSGDTGFLGENVEGFDTDDTQGRADEMTGLDAIENMEGFDFEDTWVPVTEDGNFVISFGADTNTESYGGVEPAQEDNGDGYPRFGEPVDEEVCIDRRNLSRGQEDDECPHDRDLRRGETREELDERSGRSGRGEHRDSATERRGRRR